MTKRPHITIVDTDFQYIASLQHALIKKYKDNIHLHLITSNIFFEDCFSRPCKCDVLIVSEEIYKSVLLKQNIENIFILSEKNQDEMKGNKALIYKYSSAESIIGKLSQESRVLLDLESKDIDSCRMIVFYSPSGGTGRTILAMAAGAYLAQGTREVLYINAQQMQSFQFHLQDKGCSDSSKFYKAFSQADISLYDKVKPWLKQEILTYLPPFKAPLMYLDIDSSAYYMLCQGALKSGDYSHLIVDTDSLFNKDTAQLMSMADKVVLVTSNSQMSRFSLSLLRQNLYGMETEKFMIVSNSINPNVPNKKNTGLSEGREENISYIDNIDEMKLSELAKIKDIRKIAELIRD